MNKLFGIYETLHDAGVRMFDCEVGFAKAVTVALDRDFAVFIDPSQLSGSAEETCVVAHEAGHILTGATHRVDSPVDLIERHERRAERWAIERLLPFDELCDALRSGVSEPWELAERFDLPAEFVEKALRFYEETRGFFCEPPQKRKQTKTLALSTRFDV